MDWNEFKKQPFFNRLDRWMDNQLIEDFYTPSLYNEEGELISEEEFNSEGLEEEKKTCFELALKVYNYEKEYRKHNLSEKGIMELYSFMTQGENIIKDLQKKSLLVISGMIFCIFCSELPHINKWKFLHMKHYEDLISSCFRQVADEHEWLDFYLKFHQYYNESILPKELNVNGALKYFLRLQEEGFLDEEFQFAIKRNKTAIQEQIALGFNLKTGIEYRALQSFWGIANLRTNYDERLYNKRKSIELNGGVLPAKILDYLKDKEVIENIFYSH